MELQVLFSGVPYTGTLPQGEALLVTQDSRRACPGAVFVCARGMTTDGHDHARKALEAGAVCIVTERPLGLPGEVQVASGRKAYAQLCQNFFGRPAEKLRLVAVTGTNGKTTVTTLIKQTLEQAGCKAGLIGTIHTEIDAMDVPAKYTTPEPWDLNALFSRMVLAGCTFAVMEASSQALDQLRLWGLTFEVGVFTNLTQDHLDYHKTFENYFAAKKSLFSQVKHMVVNLDDSYGRRLLDEVHGPERITFSAGDDAADYTARNIRLSASGVKFEMVGRGFIQRIDFPMPGDYSVHNALAAAAAAIALGIPARVYPGVSSIQLLSAALGRPWQDWKLVSAHGCACDPVAECMMNRSVFFLTGGTETPASLCQKLTDAGMGEAHGVVGENLGTEAEAIRYGSAAELAGQSFAPLSVLLVENFDLPQLRAPGFPDESFIRSEVPMTKQEVRAAALAKLAVMPTDTLWDVGAGTGSVSVELALAAPKGRVYAVECEPDACELIRKNRAKFHACNLILIEGRAPDVLADLPAPDAVFIGGTKGGMEAVLDEVLGKNPNARICISAIALETLGAAIAALTARGLTAEVTQIAVSRTKPAGRLHLLMANNPIFLITGTRK